MKWSEVSIPKAALDEQVPSQQLYWDIAQGSGHTEPLPAWESNFSAAPQLSRDIFQEFYQFFCGARDILLFCIATKAYTTRCCSSRQARISHLQGFLSNVGNMAPAGTCFCSPLPAGLRCVSLGRVRRWGLCQQVRDYFSSKEKAPFHKHGKFVDIRSGVNAVNFDYLQLHPKQINWDA